ncbi:MAG: hypothetical protein OEW90_07585 [Betaproteobacteria bacterium]|nr:hypothetical protein [Betaproteobacteria bacterium]
MRIAKSFAIALLVGAPLAALAQSVPYDIKVCNITEATVIDSAGDVTVLATHGRGITDSNPAGGPFDGTTYECRSVMDASKVSVEFSGRCTFVDKDGHKALGAFTGTPKGWEWKFVGGTGKWEGIRGGGTTKPLKQYARLSPTVTAACAHATGTYEINK